MNQLNVLQNTILNCVRCPRLRPVTPFPMSHISYHPQSEQSLVMIVGRNPGTEHDHTQYTQESFTQEYHRLWKLSKIGKYLYKHFEDFVDKYMFFTNMCKCASPNNSPLTFQEQENCYPYLEEQYQIIKPPIIITLGNDALQSFIPERELANSFGSSIKYKDSLLYALYHPSYFSYRPNKEKEDKQHEIFETIKQQICQIQNL